MTPVGSSSSSSVIALKSTRTDVLASELNGLKVTGSDIWSTYLATRNKVTALLRVVLLDTLKDT